MPRAFLSFMIVQTPFFKIKISLQTSAKLRSAVTVAVQQFMYFIFYLLMIDNSLLFSDSVKSNFNIFDSESRNTRD